MIRHEDLSESPTFCLQLIEFCWLPKPVYVYSSVHLILNHTDRE